MKTRSKNHYPRTSGFTLTEMLISMVVASIVLGAILTSFVQNRNVYDTQRSRNETLQNSRSALDQMSRDIRSAGYGLAIQDDHLHDWVTWVSGIDSNPFLVDGGGDAPDELYLVGAFGDPVGETTGSLSTGDTLIPYNLLADTNPFDTTQHFLVYIGRVELARIVGSGSGGLVITTDPYLNAAGLEHDYAPGTPIELISTIHYKIEFDRGDPYLARTDSLETYANPLMRMCAMNIEDLQISRSGDFIDLDIIARSMGEHLRHRDVDHGDHWIRHDIHSRVLSRNLAYAADGVAQAGGAGANPGGGHAYGNED